MATIVTIAGLNDEIKKRVNKALKEKVAPYIRDELTNQIQKNVYDAYDPVVYQRRGENGGLIDKDNFVTEFNEDNCSVYVHDDAKASSEGLGMPLDQAIEYGYGNRLNAYNRPRPFISPTQSKVDTDVGIIQQMIVDSINGK